MMWVLLHVCASGMTLKEYGLFLSISWRFPLRAFPVALMQPRVIPLYIEYVCSVYMCVVSVYVCEFVYFLVI